MRFDDRLATVLGQPAADMRGRAVQWRQLVELLARGGEISQDLADRALSRVAQLMKDLPPDLLAATSRSIAGRAVPAELVALFAARGAAASVALLTAADLTPAGWSAVKAVAAPDVLPLLSTLTDGAVATETRPVRQGSAPAARPVEPVIDATAAEPVIRADLFRWETGPTGEIDWVDGAPRSALIGQSLAESFSNSFAARLPFADEALVMMQDGAVAGEWRWSGAPAFFADTGRFAGYRGVARRDGTSANTDLEAVAAFIPAEDDGLRELMHELRTPLNAIIGFGEIIEGQYLGPAHRTYRERATEIVRQARALSDAVDNLDLAARFRSGRLQGAARTGVETIQGILEKGGQQAESRQVELTIEDRAGAAVIALPPPLAERLVQQFVQAMLQPAVMGERIAIVIDRMDTNVAIGVDRAMALRDLTEEQILADRGRAGMRFALRLVQGLAAMIGGRLDIGADRLILLLPLAA